MNIPIEETSRLLEHPDTTNIPFTKEGDTQSELKHNAVAKNGDYGDKKIQIFVVIEDLRAAYYILFFLLLGIGYILTKIFVDIDNEEHIIHVYGSANVALSLQRCFYFDFPPTTYVPPVIWILPMVCLGLYSAMSGFHVWRAKEGEKVSFCSMALLMCCFVYVTFSVILSSISLLVQPNPENPITMIVHSMTYTNLKLALCILQIAVTWFGAKVAWVGLALPGWFIKASVAHAILYALVTAVANTMLCNALGDIGHANLEGHGSLWNVNQPISKVLANLFGSFGGALLGTIIPLIQSIWLASFRKQTHPHSLIFYHY